jgi:hydrogenase nickel incorporation protein HypB
MCATCGCGNDAMVRLIDQDHPTIHSHGHAHPHPHTPLIDSRGGTITLTLEERVLAKNDHLAEQNRSWLAARGLRTLNIMSSPGSGKTTLLERTAQELSPTVPIVVIEGDQETTFDADRIRATGVRVVQVNTGAGCHLDASMVGDALNLLDPNSGLVLIENVGNLVCPALFDLGESSRVVIMSVTEGADKPLKYPHIFRGADLIVLNKVDLLPYVDFDITRFEHDARLVNPRVEIVRLSATRGDGLVGWYDWATGR